MNLVHAIGHAVFRFYECISKPS